jgi:hypothetical protein
MKRSFVMLFFAVIVCAIGGWFVFRALKAPREPEIFAFVLSPRSPEVAALSLKDLFGPAIIEQGGSYAYSAQVVQPNTTFSMSVPLLLPKK